MSFSLLLLAVPLFPLVAAVASLSLGGRLPWRGGELVFGSTVLSLAALIALFGSRSALGVTWFEVAGLRLTLGLEITGLSGFVAALVAAVSAFVVLYSLGYMAKDPGQPRYFASLGLFIGAMLALVLTDSLLLLFAAWELVGLASYLLIGFHHEQEGARTGAFKAFLMTRLGDFGLLLGWLLVLKAVGSTEIRALTEAVAAGSLSPSFLTLVALLMFAASVGKSAQLPLSTWLPDAMVAPSPVSALLHSATMVAAGVYLVLRLFPLFSAAPGALAVVAVIGGATALFAGLVATASRDLKRVLAWSTSSQLGEMLLAAGVGGSFAAAFHLATHAAFKSTLFLVAGTLDKATGTRDLTRLGGLARTMPLTGSLFLVAGLALAGVPPLSGFWSEEEILAQLASRAGASAVLMLLLTFIAGVYISRAGVTVFTRGMTPASRAAGEPGLAMLAAMMGLGAGAAALGWVLSEVLPRWLELDAPPPAPIAWRISALAASFAGLAWGGLRAWRYGPAPPFGSFPERLEAGLAWITWVPARDAIWLAAKLDTVELRLDAAVRALVRSTLWLAKRGTQIEHGLDWAAQAGGEQTWALAARSDLIDVRGFSAGGDQLASALVAGGERLRGAQSGKLYLYTLGLCAWALAVLLTGVLALTL